MDGFGHWQPFKSGRYPNAHVDGAAHTAAFHGDVEALGGLLRTYGRASAAFAPHGPAGWTPLMVAAYAGQLEAVRFLLDEGFPLEERDACLRTPIHAAVKAGRIQVVRLLLERGCDVDRMDDAQRTPLVYAAAARNVAMMSCLLDAGADPDATDQRLRCPLHYLSEGGRGRQQHHQQQQHDHYAVVTGGNGGASEEEAAVAGVRLLLLHGADPGLPDLEGHHPLHLATAASQTKVVRLLLGLGGADPTPTDSEGRTPLALAKTLEVERLLRASPLHAYLLKRLRCIAAMAPAAPAAHAASAVEGEGEEEEGEEEGPAARAAAASAVRVQHAIATYREAFDPARPLPRIAFRSPHPPPSPPPEAQEWTQERSEQEAWEGLDGGGRAALVLEEVVLHMKGDVFLELVQGSLWPWNAETLSSSPGSVPWG